MTPAQLQYLHDVARDLDAAPAADGARGQIVARASKALGKSPKTLYALLRKHAGWQSGRKPRADAGQTCVDRDLALAVGGYVHLSRRQTGKKTRTIKGVRKTLAANGLGIVNTDTGEIIMPSAATLSRAMRQHCCHPDQLCSAAPATSLRSLHPNHTWQVDASVCVLYRMRGSQDVRLLNERDYNAHKPGKLIEISGQRIIRYVVTDHNSGSIYLRYEQARGEDALGVITTIINAIEDRGARDPMHGAPAQLLMDPGSGNKSSLVLNFLQQLDITPLHHAAGNARATGSVEVAQNIVETQFEGRLRFMDIPSVAELQAKADAWRCHYNATAVLRRAGKTRNAIWGSITSAQLRTVSREVMEAIAAWGDVRRTVDGHFRISVDTRAFGVREYDLRELGYHGLCVGDSVRVRLNPFLAPVIRVIKMQADGTELVFEVSPIDKDAAGFDITAPVIGQEYRAQPKTRTQRALDDVLKTAYGTASVGEATKHHKARSKTPFADIDPMADVKQAPMQFRASGTPMDVAGTMAAAMPLNHAQAAQRLRGMCGQAWKDNPTGCMALIKQRFPTQVPEDKLQDLADAINGLHAGTQHEVGAHQPANAANVTHVDLRNGGLACAN